MSPQGLPTGTLRWIMAAGTQDPLREAEDDK